MHLPEGLIAVVKQDCPTCVLVDPVLASIERSGLSLTVYVQDEPGFPSTRQVVDDRSLEASYRLHIEIVPTLIRVAGGREQARVVGWERDEWRALTGIASLGSELPGFEVGVWHILYAPKNTPADVITLLQTGLQAAIKDPAFAAKMKDLGAEIMPADRQTSAGAKALLAAEITKWSPIIQAAKAYAD